MKKIILSGFSGGMGLETAKKFASNGYFVFGLDINEPKEEIENSLFIKTDLRNMGSVNKAFKIISKETDSIDLIINMAGTYVFNSLVEMKEEDFVRIFDINVFSIYRMNKTFLPLLSKGGKIIIVSSELAATDPLPFTGLYGVTKATIEKYAYALRMELQLLDYQVSVIRPGAVSTSFLNISTTQIERFHEDTKLYKETLQKYRKIVDSVEGRTIPPSKIADIAYKISKRKKPKYIYKINRNPLLLLLTHLPKRFQNWIIKRILTK